MERSNKNLRPLLVILFGAFLLRVVLLCATPAYPYDQSVLFAWANRIAEVGPADFYVEGYLADYPPGYMLLWGVGALLRLFHLQLPQVGAVLVMAIPPMVCDLALAVVIWKIGQKHLGQRQALWLAAFGAFCPALLYDTGVWKQVDGVICLFLVLTFWLLEEKKFLLAAFTYGLGLALKPQALLLGPVLALCFLSPLVPAKGQRLTGSAIKKTVTQGVAGVAAALFPVLATALPFTNLASLPTFIIDKYFSTTKSYAYGSVNAFNLMSLLGGNWAPQEDRIRFLPFLSWQGLGVALLTLATLAMAALAVISIRKGKFSPLLLAAFYEAAVFTLSHRMHERYLLAGLMLLLAAVAIWPDRWLLGAAAGFSLTSLLNQAVVYSQVGTDDEFYASWASRLMLYAISAAQVVLFVVLVVAVWQICSKGTRKPWVLKKSTIPEPGQPQPAWSRGEALLLAGITLLTGVISFTGLGDHSAPQTVLNAREQTVTGQIQASGQPAALWVYSGVSDDGLLTLSDEQGNVVAQVELGHTNTFRWTSTQLPALAQYQVKLERGSVVELAMKDAQGNLIPLSATSEFAFILDEQELVPEEISFKNSMYFDEIYHARTAYEQLHQMPIYETTHPPLGKVFIMLGIALFGMTGFGWRCAGAAFGVAMVPVMYLLVRRLTRSPKLASVAAVLLALDGMRFVQSRIATIDVYGTFFILLGAYFMVWYCQSALEKGVLGSLLPMALCGISFGLGAASKWTGIYAGAGLAVLYFGVLWMRYRKSPQTFPREAGEAVACGVLFFVLIPMLIYYGSYFVYWMQDPGFGASQWWQQQLYMFRYHHDLDATHPFSSNWYAWPLMLRPVWYYTNDALPQGVFSSIAGIGNPVVWWAGSAAVLWVLWRQISAKGTPAGGAVMVLYLTQLLPWMLVPRCTFLYHYFPSLMFVIPALMLLLQAVGREHPPVAARWLGIGLLVLAAMSFFCLLPPLSGIAVPEGWAQLTRWLPSWRMYSL